MVGMGSTYVQLQPMVHRRMTQLARSMTTLHVGLWVSCHDSVTTVTSFIPPLIRAPNLRAITSTEASGTLQFSCSLGLDWLGCGCS